MSIISQPQLLPTVRLGAAEITRLIIGGNPVSGVSHQTPALDAEMVNYFTTARIKEHLFECERQGLSAMLLRGDRHIHRVLAEYRAEGGRMQWIGQLASEHANWQWNFRQMAQAGAVALYVHGSAVDNQHFKTGRQEELVPLLKFIREELGLPAGLCSHNPDWLRYAEDHHWPVDWYMVCLYNLTREERDSPLTSGKFHEEKFQHADRGPALDFIAATAKPCVAFKILGGGRLSRTAAETRQSFAEVFGRIKPSDAVCVGMWNRDQNQIAANAALVRELGGKR